MTKEEGKGRRRARTFSESTRGKTTSRVWVSAVVSSRWHVTSAIYQWTESHFTHNALLTVFYTAVLSGSGTQIRKHVSNIKLRFCFLFEVRGRRELCSALPTSSEASGGILSASICFQMFHRFLYLTCFNAVSVLKSCSVARRAARRILLLIFH